MGRFSCFYGHAPGQKQKKSAQPSFEAMVKTLQLGSQNNESALSGNPITRHEFHIGKSEASETEHLTLASRSWKSGEVKCDYDVVSNADSMHFQTGNIRRSLSVGCELEKERIFGVSNGDDCYDQEFSFEGSHDCDEVVDVSPTNDARSQGISSPDQNHEASRMLCPNISSDIGNQELVVAVYNPQYLNKEGLEDSHRSLHMGAPDGSGQNSPTQSCISKSYSMPNFGSMSPTSPGLSACVMLPSRNRSFEDLKKLFVNNESVSAHNAEIVGLCKDDNLNCPEKFDGENAVLNGYDSYNYGCSSKDWIVSMPDEIGVMGHGQGNSSSDPWGDFANREFKTKLIEDWVIDLQHCSPIEETNEVADSGNEVKRRSAFLDGLDKVDMNLYPGMEAAKRYISSLNATTTTAQLANHGLVVIPLLSAFVGLKVLNLSGNSIVRITAGALPRGLHMLNLSKNKISTIEGLRELTRLRILDLSYNKISRIGHGLTSCSTLKELYLAGNKISEVEGLHRLLKLTVLDLRFNKIATSKGLGQLAANYNSLQAISLEGNPAQKNVGDEQLKKYLQDLLPYLAYYNRLNIKSSTLKDSSDRSVRLGISDRGLRSDHKSSSRSGSGAPKRSTHSYTHGQKGQSSDSLRQSKGKHVLVPPSGAKPSHHHNNIDFSNKLQSLRSGLSLHKSRSEGTLAVL
ncbi:uncharacterized protein LOC110693938 isoform X1 [Chenopodium quinoa]|uniref:uncharacterized protein LOC110693938 isoform X1 n=1 Tax=Chenopodium quinoa TaxID=63459 RepID=UPI000B78013A|nr:uncharacterized protein LOC110693938 isoform X1 [Chenopodium quinoa]XP_021726818.1 uncharacterized protein LOC110693938 isoform X1 [Chenopodium quinoa]